VTDYCMCSSFRIVFHGGTLYHVANMNHDQNFHFSTVISVYILVVSSSVTFVNSIMPVYSHCSGLVHSEALCCIHV